MNFQETKKNTPCSFFHQLIELGFWIKIQIVWSQGALGFALAMISVRPLKKVTWLGTWTTQHLENGGHWTVTSWNQQENSKWPTKSVEFQRNFTQSAMNFWRLRFQVCNRPFTQTSDQQRWEKCLLDLAASRFVHRTMACSVMQILRRVSILNLF